MAGDRGKTQLHFPCLLLITLVVFLGEKNGIFGQLEERCLSHDGQQGLCQSLISCVPYRDMLKQRPILPNTIAFLQRAHCGFQASSPRSVGYETWPSEERAAEGWHGGNVSAHPHWRLLLTDKCGMAVTHRIFGGTEAQIGEYPWLALLEYHTKNGLQLLCGGALIGVRYVLTAAHCLEDTEIGRLSGVRLGEHDTETDPDCLEYGDEVVCGDPVQRRRIAEVTIHPNYRNYHGVVENDIGLVRLDRPVPITDFVVPICLPNGAALTKNYEGESMFVAGWGRTENSSRSHVKLWVGVPVVPNRICAPIYSHQITLRDDQMCAGGQEGRDSCMGDSGGPLMTVDDVVAERKGGQWVAAGVVSFGPVLCASGGKPGIYTRVSPYVRWILDSLEP